MHQKDLKIFLSICVGKWLVAVKSILRIIVIKSWYLIYEKYIHSKEYIFVEF